VAVVQRSIESTAVQELYVAEQGGWRELGFGVAAAMGMRRRGAAVRLKDVAGVLGVRATNGRSVRIAGLTPRAREADRDVALRDPGLWAKLLEGRGAVWLADGPREGAWGGAGHRTTTKARRRAGFASRATRHGEEGGSVCWAPRVGGREERQCELGQLGRGRNGTGPHERE
jgi:hypothetical protein